MAITTIPWGDGSGGNIYVSASSQTGAQAVSVSSDANTGAARSKTVTFTASGVSPVTLTVSQEAGEITPNHPCLTFKSSSSNTLSLSCNGTAEPVLYYSTDGTTWTLWDYSALAFSEGHPVFIYGNNTSGFSTSDSNYSLFVIDGNGNATCDGSVATLVNGTNDLATIPCSYCFTRLFRDCTKLVSGPSLPSTTLNTYCYALMFYGCSSLETAPELPATTLMGRCYNQMFRGCSNLETAPDLPADALVSQCYHYMFYGCSKLNYVKALFTTTPSTSYTSNWLNRVASSGTFVKSSSATWTTTGVSAVPSGWTIQTASS